MPRKKIVEQCRPCVTDMQMAGWAWGITNTNFFICQFKFRLFQIFPFLILIVSLKDLTQQF
jgi:hypothetical protein